MPGERKVTLRFLSDFEKVGTMDEERNFAKTIADVKATSWHLHETIRVRELAATHRTGQMRRLLVHEEHKAWKRDFGFDYIEIAADMDVRCSNSKTLFYRNMLNL